MEVKVAVMIRSLVVGSGSSCITRSPNKPQVSIGQDNQTFTFNYVYDGTKDRGKVYSEAVVPLMKNLFRGYNLTILAYGQTGSGKTHTMGFTDPAPCYEVIPKAFRDIFSMIDYRKGHTTFSVSVSFLEVYNEALYDLLTDKPRDQSIVDMREVNNGICIPGLTEVTVQNVNDAQAILKKGRDVRATAMNSASSRSHAVFTINMKMTNKAKPEEVMTSKFQLVDLAGSGISKKTTRQAAGDWFNEEFNIKKDLLTLDCVISQLSDGVGYNYVDYRDSKLTRLLQDSLGGNSFTLMIACVNPADLEESTRTLLCAVRAMKIMNKPVVNKDPASAEISRLRKEIEELRMKLHVSELRTKIIGNGLSRCDCPPERKKLEDDLRGALQKNNELSCTLLAVLKQDERSVMADKLEESLNEKHNVIDSKLENTQNEAEQVCVQQERVALVQKAQQDEHILAQAQINKEINTITKSLVWKEELLANLRISAVQLREMAGRESMEELAFQIAELRTEKDELLEQSKVLEERRKRLTELIEVASLLKKVAKQEGSSK